MSWYEETIIILSCITSDCEHYFQGDEGESLDVTRDDAEQEGWTVGRDVGDEHDLCKECTEGIRDHG